MNGPRAPKLNPNTKKRPRPKRDRSDRYSRMREGGPARENSPACMGRVFFSWEVQHEKAMAYWLDGSPLEFLESFASAKKP